MMISLMFALMLVADPAATPADAVTNVHPGAAGTLEPPDTTPRNAT